MEDVKTIASKLVQAGKGILAADESMETAGERFAVIGVENSEEARRRYRELFIGTPGIHAWMSGIILHDETVSQHMADGRPFLDVLHAEGILLGVKVDEGKEPDPNSPEETVTKGLESLHGRLPTYAKRGISFAKWRAVIRVGELLPTLDNIERQCADLAQFARACVENAMVPICEPEVLMNGNHSIERAGNVAIATLMALFAALERAGVDPAYIILKTSMVIPGKEFALGKATPEQVAEETLRALQVVVPKNIGGVVFLSGGQGAIEATQNLAAICSRGAPWPMSFSFARALQEPTLLAWNGEDANLDHARAVFVKRLRLNAIATQGAYARDLEDKP